jgi:hypothetical protein
MIPEYERFRTQEYHAFPELSLRTYFMSVIALLKYLKLSGIFKDVFLSVASIL